MLSTLGPVTLSRDYYHPPGPEGGFPLDRALGLIGNCTPGAARMLARTAAQLPYLESSHQLQELAGLKVDPSQIQRLVQLLGPPTQERLLLLPGSAAPKAVPQLYVSVDGTGVPMVRAELEGRVGRGPDGKAKTREVKLAAIFTQTTTDQEGYPIRDPHSTTYTGAIETAEEFGKRIYVEAIRTIEPGEELTVDYNFEYVGDRTSCACGAPKCRSVMERLTPQLERALAKHKAVRAAAKSKAAHV